MWALFVCSIGVSFTAITSYALWKYVILKDYEENISIPQTEES